MRQRALLLHFSREKTAAREGEHWLGTVPGLNNAFSLRQIRYLDRFPGCLVASGASSYGIKATRDPDRPARRNSVRKISAIGCTVFLFSVLAEAQIPTGGNVFFGYSYSRGNAFTRNFAPPPTPANPSINMNGWAASVEGKYLPWIGVVADFDWHYGSRGVNQCTPPGCTSTTPFRLNA